MSPGQADPRQNFQCSIAAGDKRGHPSVGSGEEPVKKELYDAPGDWLVEGIVAFVDRFISFQRFRCPYTVPVL